MSDDREPDAYGLLDEGEVWYATPFRIEAERVLTRTGDTDSAIVSLYRSLTDAERAAVERVAGLCAGWAALAKTNELAGQDADTLRSLLERMA